jgi:hypothetical protein
MNRPSRLNRVRVGTDATQAGWTEALIVSLAQCRASLGRESHLVTPAPTRKAVEERTTRRTAFLACDRF